jgi:RNA polymerase sigma-70 factor (ECF subfamily)
MSEQDLDQRLSHITTMWTVLTQAHRGEGDEAAAARQLLMLRYCGAVYRYLLSAVRDPHVAEDLTQEFALRFVQGRFRQADREHGRFRNYVKTALFHLVDDYRRRQGRLPHAVALEEGEPPAAPEDRAAEQAFLDNWRQELLARAWKALAQVQQESGQPYYDVLRLRVEAPELPSADLAARLGARLGRPFTAAGVRQTLHRARERFADLLLEETRQSLGDSARGHLEEELAELNLLRYCQSALQRRASPGGS